MCLLSVGDGITKKDFHIEMDGVPPEYWGCGIGGAALVMCGHGENAMAKTVEALSKGIEVENSCGHSIEVFITTLR
ncbi:MAG: hypothetical protein ABID54_14675 [Pseudomonadota bacterium]